jgi:indole-3-glycerol phosphate synthase
MNILQQIVEKKKVEVEKRKAEIQTSVLEKSFYFNRKTLSLKKSLNEENTTGIIAEFKRKSPSKGILNDKVLIEELVKSYYNNGASGISVLTDEQFFGGSNKDLMKTRELVNIPLLRKDFIIDEYQLIEAKATGADVILLIAACLKPSEVKRLADAAKKLGLEILLELHNEGELEHICDEVDLVGINNRNLENFEVNIERSMKMAEKMPVEKIKIAESGIDSVKTICLFKENGFKGFLIGEYFMKQQDPAKSFKEFVNKLKSEH